MDSPASHLSRLSRVRALRDRLVYRADTFLSRGPLLQIAVLVVFTALVVGGWALALMLVADKSELTRPGEALWWSVARFFDGGTMAGDPAGYRLLALGVTSSGVIVVSFLTATFATKMNERIADLRSGYNPVVERGHILVLGFDAKVALFLREVARSGQRVTVVVMALEGKARIDLAIRGPRRIPNSRIKIVVRTGDPRSEHALRRVSAEAARAIVVVPPPQCDDRQSLEWTLATLLAVRRLADYGFTGEVVVEAKQREARELLCLAGEADVAGETALVSEVIASDEVVAKVLAQSVRQAGVYFTLQQFLQFDERDLYLDPVPRELIGKSFEAAHAAISGAILIGVRRGNVLEFDPSTCSSVDLRASDQMIVLARASGDYTLDGKLPKRAPLSTAEAPQSSISRVVILGNNRTLPNLLGDLDGTLARGSQITVICGEAAHQVRESVRRAEQTFEHVTIEVSGKKPTDMARACAGPLADADAVVILASPDEHDEDGDASALALLLWLRHGIRERRCSVKRIVTEVRDPRFASYVKQLANDFVVSSEVVAMLLAQEALCPDLAAVYREIMSPVGTEVYLHPRALYVPEGATFADAMAAARGRGEIAIGLYPAPDGSEVWLNPPREAKVPAGRDAAVVVLAHEIEGSSVRSRRIALQMSALPGEI